MTKPVRLAGDGPFVTPAVEGCLGLAISGGRLPVQIRLVLSGGQELHLPTTDIALSGLYRVPHAHFDEKKPKPGK